MEEQQNVPQPNWTTWWNHSCYTGIPWLSALHCLQQLQSGACSTSTTQPLSLTQESNGTTPSGPAQLAAVTQFCYLSFSGGRHSQCPYTDSLCSVPSTHHATTADASTQLSISEFLQLCFTKHPFRRTVPLHEDLREAQTPNNTGTAMAAAFADAATQLSFAGFFERCILSRDLPPRPQPSPTPLQDASIQFFLGCVRSNDSLDRQPTLPSHGNLSSAPLHHPKHMDATLSISSTSGGDVRTPVPRAQLATACSPVYGHFWTGQTCWTWPHSRCGK